MNAKRRQAAQHFYSVSISSYASLEVKEQVQRGAAFLYEEGKLVIESVYQGSSESKVGTAFYRAVKLATANPLAFHVIIWRDGKRFIQVRIEHPGSDLN